MGSRPGVLSRTARRTHNAGTTAIVAAP